MMNNLAFIGEQKFTAELVEKIRSGSGELPLKITHLETIEGAQSTLSSTEFDLVIDTFEGDADIYLQRILEIENVLSKQTAIAAYHPQVSTTEIWSSMKQPERFIGIHFFRIDQPTNLVEIVKPEQGDNVELRCAISQLLTSAGFSVVQIKDRPGLLAHRLLVPYLNQAAQVFDDSIASAVDIDNSVILGLGYPAGPLALLDRIGIDRHLHIAENLHRELSYSKYHAPPILKKMNQAGLIGKKAGKGFYSYE